MKVPFTIGTVGHFGLAVRDPRRSAKWFVRVLGVRKEFRTRRYAGLAYLLCDEIYRRAGQRGYEWAEFSWTLEDNHLINSLITKVGCRHYKTYRIYEKPL